MMATGFQPTNCPRWAQRMWLCGEHRLYLGAHRESEEKHDGADDCSNDWFPSSEHRKTINDCSQTRLDRRKLTATKQTSSAAFCAKVAGFPRSRQGSDRLSNVFLY